MRIYLFIIIAAAGLMLASCSSVNKVETRYEDGSLMEEYYVLKKDPSIRDGTYHRYDDEENLLESVQYVNGTVEGPRKIYYPNGQLMILETYMNGRFQGPYQTFYESGNKNEEGSYSDNQMEGEWRYYYDSEGNPVREVVQFRDNMENGPFREYHENGQLKAEGTYKDEYEDGMFREYDADGNLIKEILYDSGRPVVYKEFDAAGNIVKESDYR